MRLLGQFGRFRLKRGVPYPFGPNPTRAGVNFAVFARHATRLSIVLFEPGADVPLVELPLDPQLNRTGDVWHALVTGPAARLQYGYRVNREPNHEPHLHRYDPAAVVIDPYSKAVVSRVTSTNGHGRRSTRKGPRREWRSVIRQPQFDWGADRQLNTHLADSVIYELHVRGFTVHPSSGVTRPGTFRGIVEKIPYLKDLGVTAVELMPVTEFDEFNNPRVNPLTGEALRDFWGYDPVSFLAAKPAYGGASRVGAEVTEFQSMVKALHEAGIEVILDIVLNHTGEGDERGRTISWRGLDNRTYYIVDPVTGRYHNYSGCGNTFNCNHPVARTMLVACLRYWATEMHVDGFRFDLASILGRGQDGEVLFNPPLLERIAAEPVLADTKLIAEAWDAAGLYQVGTFPNWRRWAEWNGRFRDDARRFLRGEAGMVGAIATRLSGSADLYQAAGRAPFHGVNFVTCHDGFTLADLFACDRKHNEANGEGGDGGQDINYSWNCGVEGPTGDESINRLRRRMARNALVLLLASQGVPMLLGGDERGRTQGGNNNAYCQDNETSWMDWRLDAHSRGLLRFTRLLIAFRRRHPGLRRRSYLEAGPEGWPAIWWHGEQLNDADWSESSRAIAMHLPASGRDTDIYLILNMHWEPRRFELPALPGDRRWFRVVDTSCESPDDIAEAGRETPIEDRFYLAGPRSSAMLVGQ